MPIRFAPVRSASEVEETFTEDRSSFQTEVFLRNLISNYKTPILLNEIFK